MRCMLPRALQCDFAAKAPCRPHAIEVQTGRQAPDGHNCAVAPQHRRAPAQRRGRLLRAPTPAPSFVQRDARHGFGLKGRQDHRAGLDPGQERLDPAGRGTAKPDDLRVPSCKRKGGIKEEEEGPATAAAPSRPTRWGASERQHESRKVIPLVPYRLGHILLLASGLKLYNVLSTCYDLVSCGYGMHIIWLLLYLACL